MDTTSLTATRAYEGPQIALKLSYVFDPGVDSVRIVRREDDYPQTVRDGLIVYEAPPVTAVPGVLMTPIVLADIMHTGYKIDSITHVSGSIWRITASTADPTFLSLTGNQVKIIGAIKPTNNGIYTVVARNQLTKTIDYSNAGALVETPASAYAYFPSSNISAAAPGSVTMTLTSLRTYYYSVFFRRLLPTGLPDNCYWNIGDGDKALAIATGYFAEKLWDLLDPYYHLQDGEVL